MEIDILTEEQYKTLSKKLVSAIEGQYKIIALNTLQSTGYILRKPIYITIEIEEDKVIASLDDIEAFAYADTEYEAINLLCKDIVSVYEDLKEDKSNLGRLPGKWLAFLEDFIEDR